jgi:ribose-phosphate pyrophosphokinase
MNERPPLLVALSESRTLAAEIGRLAGFELAPLEERSFEEGEFKLRPLTSVRNRTVFVVQSLASSPEASVAQRLVRLLFLLFGLHDAGADRLTAVIPYLAFARKDRRTQLRDPVNARYVAQLLEVTGIDRLVTLDAHNAAALDNAFRVPVDHLSAIPMFVDHFARQGFTAPIAVASPDVGGIKRAQIFHELLARRLGKEIELAFIEKRRARGAFSGGRVVGEVDGREVIVLDDLCASGGTLIHAAGALREAGASAVHVAFTHAPLPKGLAALTASPEIVQIVLTDSVGSALPGLSSDFGRMKVLHVGPLLGQAIGRMITGIPLATLLESWPPADGR